MNPDKKIDPKDYDDVVKNRKAMKDACNEAAMRGDPICGAYMALRALDPMAAFIDDLADYDDEYQDEDDCRPF